MRRYGIYPAAAFRNDLSRALKQRVTNIRSPDLDRWNYMDARSASSYRMSSIAKFGMGMLGNQVLGQVG